MPTEPSHILLIGFMGSGKSSVAPWLAGRLGRPYWELDRQLVERYALTIPEIFGRYGEDGFRRAERVELFRLLLEPPAVVALGGGAFHEQNRRYLPANTRSVWLDVTWALAWERCRHDANRPLAQSEPEFKRLHELRGVDYAQASLRVAVERKSPREIAQEIDHLLNKLKLKS